MDYEIYKITRPSIDDAVYYGQHCLQKRGGKNYMGTGINILESLRLYGRKAHVKEILFTVSTQDDADEKEKLVIQNAITNKENLLNIDYGGQKTKIISDNTRKKQSESHKGKSGWHHTSETRLKIAASHIGIGKGRKLTAEHKLKILEGVKGHNVSLKTREKLREANRINAENGLEGAKAVICLDTNKKYFSISHASRDTGISISTIARCASGKCKQAKGTHWAYA